MCIHQGVRVCYVEVTRVFEKHKTTSQELFIYPPPKKKTSIKKFKWSCIIKKTWIVRHLTHAFYYIKGYPLSQVETAQIRRKIGNYFPSALFWRDLRWNTVVTFESASMTTSFNSTCWNTLRFTYDKIWAID